MVTNLQTIPTLFLRPLSIVRSYQRSQLRPDLVAGLTVAIISIPQAIAYALVAGLPPQMGLYAAIVLPIVAALWGSSSQVQSTPTTALSLLVLASLSAAFMPNTTQFILAAGLLAVLTGFVQLVMGVGRLGILVNFVSDAVIVGFAAGAGIQIAAGELRHLFGLTFTSSSLLGTVSQLVLHLPQTHLPTLALGLGTLLLMIKPRHDMSDIYLDFLPQIPCSFVTRNSCMNQCRVLYVSSTFLCPSQCAAVLGSGAAELHCRGVAPQPCIVHYMYSARRYQGSGLRSRSCHSCGM